MSALTFGTWCSGIEAASEAWTPLGWRCAYVAEIEPFPCAYLAQVHGAERPRYMPRPEDASSPKEARRRATKIKALAKIAWGDRLPNLGDISQVNAAELPKVDIIGAGFPCQDFSIAGLRASLNGARGSISTTGVRLLLEAEDHGLVRGAVLEQVPDVLNTADNAWGNILGALVGSDVALEGLDHGGKWPRAGMVAGPRARVAWRILDAQHFGLAQRRERVWAVVDFGNGPDPAAVLFERKGVLGDTPTRREAAEGVAGTLTARSGNNSSRPAGAHGTLIPDGPLVPVAYSIQAGAVRENPESGPGGVGIREGASYTLEARSEVQAVAYSIMPMNSGKDYKARETDIAQPVMAGGPVGGNQGGDYVVQPIAFNARQDPISGPVVGPVVGPVDTDGGTHAIAFSLRGREGGAMPEVEAGGVSPALRAAEGGSTRPFVAFQGRGSNIDLGQDVTGTLGSNADRASGGAPCIASPMAVRRITVVEAEILQGFPPNRTLIHWPRSLRKGVDLAETLIYLRAHGFSDDDAADLARTPDGPRYCAIGNSWPVPVAAWIGRRIATSLEFLGAAA